MRTQPGKLLGIVLVAAFALGGCESARDQLNVLKSRREFKQGNQAYANKDYQSAIDFYNRTLELDEDPDPRVLVPTHFYRASSHHLIYRPGRFDDPENDAHLDLAIEGYEESLELARVHTPAFEMLEPYQQYSMEQLAAIYRDTLTDMRNAERYFMALIELDPETPERYYALADVYERFHDPEEMPLLEKAVEAYKKPVEMSPQDPLAYRQVANLLNKYGRFEETMEWLARARDVRSSNPEGYYLIAVHYWDKVYRDPDLDVGQKREYIELGLEELEDALEIDDEYVDALIYKNLLLRENAKVDPARSAELEAEANEVRDRALRLREEQEAAEEAAAAAEAEAAQTPPTNH